MENNEMEMGLKLPPIRGATRSPQIEKDFQNDLIRNKNIPATKS